MRYLDPVAAVRRPALAAQNCSQLVAWQPFGLGLDPEVDLEIDRHRHRHQHQHSSSGEVTSAVLLSVHGVAAPAMLAPGVGPAAGASGPFVRGQASLPVERHPGMIG